MAKKTPEIAEIVKDYIVRYPDEFKRTLARRIYDERRDIFGSIEQVRGQIRYYTHSHGERARSHTRGKKSKGYEAISDVMAQYKLQSQLTKSTDAYILPYSKRIGVMSDLHIPYHDISAIETVIDYYRQKDITALLINGDLIDFYQISRWSRDPERVSVAYEIEQVIEFIEMLRYIWPDLPLYWKLGNHEDRYEAFMLRQAKELLGIPDFNMESLFELDQHQITLIGSRQKIKCGKLNIVHGHEFGQSIFSPVNPARGLFLRAKASILAGHNHQTSEHHENDINGNPTGCWSTGCLCNLSPEYRPFAYTKWNTGAALINLDTDGSFQVDNFRIIDGRIK